MAMKANELMIGDWVHVEHNGKASHFGKVTALLSSGAVETEIEGSHALSSSVEPIPLTSEILEKNGFECRGAWMIPGEDFGLRQDCDSWGVLPYYADYNALALCHIAYLHELQHLLHLCGIEEEIML